MTRRAVRRLMISLSLVLMFVGGCSNPCAEIAETACATAGAESEECTRLQTMASRASTQDRRACEVALNLVESLEKVQ